MTSTRTLRQLALTTMLSAAIIYSATAAEPKKDPEKFAAGRLLIKGKPGLHDNKLLEILAKHAAKSERKIAGPNIHVVKVPPGLEKKLVSELQNDPNIEFAELDALIEPNAIPNDPSYSAQWHLPKIAASTAWDTTSGAGVTIAIVDTGVDGTHPDLAASMVPGWNAASSNADSSDVYGHGTKVAGTAAAIKNNAIGVAGVAGGAKIMPVRITNNSTTGTANSSDIITGTAWAIDHGAKIINVSFGGFEYASTSSSGAYAKSKGAVLIYSAGNDGLRKTALADSNVIVVSATDGNDAKASWSSYGPAVDVSAPGVSILSTTKGGGYAGVNGTSFSAPITSGVAALVASVNPGLSPNDIETILKTTAVDPVAGVDFDERFGYGRVSAAGAVALAKTFTPTVADTFSPSVSISSALANTTVKGLVPVDVTANDNVAIARVDLYVNGALYASDNTAPYSFSWDTTPLGNNPSVTLSAVATDTSNNKASTAGVKVIVSNIVDTTAPVVSIGSLVDGATVSGNVTIKASATDNLGLVSMSMLIDGKQVATSSAGTLSYTWNTRKAAAGLHTIVVKATDTSNNVGQTTITVKR